MFNFQDQKIQEIIDKLAILKVPDRAHGLDHWKRVAKWTWNLFQEEEILNLENFRKATACALLHDCYPVAKDSPDRKNSASLSATRASDWLKELKWNNEDIEEIVMAIEDHSFSGGKIPRTHLGKCLQDADRLEALGAFGLYRTIVVGVAMGADLFHETDPWANHRELNDRKYSIDHFYTKLLKLPATFQTTTGRKIAIERADFLKLFLKQLKNEMEID